MSQYDVAIVGGGVTGCASLWELTNHGYKCALLEKNHHLVSEASSGNSGMLHTGFDAPEDSLELECIQRSYRRVFGVADKLGVPIKKHGAIMVAWNDDQIRRFPEIVRKSQKANVSDIQQLSLSELRRKEPNLSDKSVGALWIPSESVMDSWLFPTLLAHSAKKKGAKVFTNHRVQSCHRDGSTWSIDTTGGHLRARAIINCAGLYGDIVETLGGQGQFRIKPRKGQYLIYDHSAKNLLNASLLPIPTKVTKGIIVFKSVYGNVVVGPTAENVDSRRRAEIDDDITKRLLSIGRQTVTSLTSHKVVSMYTGVRPATERSDYILTACPDRDWVTVGGIRSTGLSGCLGISEKVKEFMENILKIEPTRGQHMTLSRPEVTFTRYGSALIDQEEYFVTHPLTLAGNKVSASKL